MQPSQQRTFDRGSECECQISQRYYFGPYPITHARTHTPKRTCSVNDRERERENFELVLCSRYQAVTNNNIGYHDDQSYRTHFQHMLNSHTENKKNWRHLHLCEPFFHLNVKRVSLCCIFSPTIVRMEKPQEFLAIDFFLLLLREVIQICQLRYIYTHAYLLSFLVCLAFSLLLSSSCVFFSLSCSNPRVAPAKTNNTEPIPNERYFACRSREREGGGRLEKD